MCIFAGVDVLKKREILLYTLLWALVFATVPLMLGYYYISDRDAVFETNEVWRGWLAILPFLVLFLAHHLAAYPLLERKPRVWYFLCVALILGLFGLWCFKFRVMPHEQLPPLFEPGMDWQPPMDKPREPPMDGHRPLRPQVMHFIIGVLIIAADLGIKSFFHGEREHRRLEAMRAENLAGQLETLRYQINPHFFMNTLNNIHALVDIDPESAKTAVEEFSKLMRIVLYDGNAPVIPLSKELDYLSHYVSLMKLRYPDSVDIQLDVPESCYTAVVPPLVMASFAENAFKHGISYESHSYVHIKVALEKDKIIFRCKNSRHPSQGTVQHGLGLENVHKRLELQYGENYTLHIDNAAESYEVLLIIPSTC